MLSLALTNIKSGEMAPVNWRRWGRMDLVWRIRLPLTRGGHPLQRRQLRKCGNVRASTGQIVALFVAENRRIHTLEDVLEPTALFMLGHASGGGRQRHLLVVSPRKPSQVIFRRRLQ